MDKLRGLLSSRLGSLGELRQSTSKDEPKESLSDVLERLPRTKQFLENSPLKVVEEQARKNDVKALEALEKLKQVDKLIGLHEDTAAELREHVSELSALKADISRAVEHAYSIQQQLFELQREITEAENIATFSKLRRLRAEEEEKFNIYVESKRADLARKKAEYSQQLQQFERERFSIGADTSMERQGWPSKRPAPVSARSDNSVPQQDISNLDIRLPSKAQQETRQEEDGAGNSNELDDFLGNSSDGGVTAAAPARKTEVKKQSKPQTRPARPQILSDEDFADD